MLWLTNHRGEGNTKSPIRRLIEAGGSTIFMMVGTSRGQDSRKNGNAGGGTRGSVSRGLVLPAARCGGGEAIRMLAQPAGRGHPGACHHPQAAAWRGRPTLRE